MEQESLELTCEVDDSAMKEEEEENEQEEAAENDFGEHTLHCGECDFKVGFS